MTEKKVSIRRVQVSEKVLKLMKDELKAEWRKKYGIADTYSDKINRNSQALTDYDKVRIDIIKKISEKVENYAVASFKEYGITKISICKRDNPNSGKLDIQLSVKNFPEKEIEKFKSIVDKEDKSMMQDRDAIDKWYSDALDAIMRGNELPKRPKIL
jgi:hypothetical protein